MATEVTLNRPVAVPAIREVGRASVEQVLQDLTAWVRTREGKFADGLDAAITLRDLSSVGALSLAQMQEIVSRRRGVVLPPLNPVPGGSVPPAASALVASVTPSAVILRWNMTAFAGITKYEVWRSVTNALGDAVLIAEPVAQLFFDPVGPASGNLYYWVRAVAEQPGPWNAVSGTLANTSNITSDMIESLVANKITAGYIAAAIALNGASVFGATLYAGGTTTTITDGLGNVTGFIANNPTVRIESGLAIFNTDAFQIRDAANTFVPFEVIGGVVRIKTLHVGDIESDNYIPGVSGYRLDRDTGTVIALAGQFGGLTAEGTRTVLRTGAYMKVTGAPFGSTSQFIEWYGPELASIALCTEANAIYYLKTNGDAYFGGSLAAGILRNAAQSTSTSATAEVEVGPFLTNGDPKSVVLTYIYRRSFSCDHGTGSGTGTGSATVVLERAFGAGAWTQIGTITVSGTPSVLVDGDPGAPDVVDFSMSGSTTVTDTSGAATDMRLRGRITARSLPTLTGTNITGDLTVQTVGVVSTE